VWQDLSQELASFWRPWGFVVSTRTLRLESMFMLEPLMTKIVEAAGTDHQPLSGCGRIKLAGIERGKDFLDEERGGTIG